MTYQKLMTDFVRRYRTYIMYAVVTWFIITLMMVYEVISSSNDINMMMCFGYVKAKMRSWLFFLPDNWLSGISVKAGTGHFRRFISIWRRVFEENGWKLYLYTFGTFAISLFACGATAYAYLKRQLDKFRQNTSTAGLLLNPEEYQEKYPESFGNQLTFAGLSFSEQIFKTPLYVWGNNDAINIALKQFLEEARSEKKKVIVLENGNALFKSLAKKDDVLFDISGTQGCSWNFTLDLRHNPETLGKELVRLIGAKSKREEMMAIIDHLASLSTEEFFQALCFAPFKESKSQLALVANVDDNQDALIKIRNYIADILYCLKPLTLQSKKISFHEFANSDNSVFWISNIERFKSAACLVEIAIGSNIFKISLGENTINLTENAMIINHSLENYMKLYRKNKLMLSYDKKLIKLFGETTTTYPSFFGMQYKHTVAPIISGNSGHSFFQSAHAEDVLRLS